MKQKREETTYVGGAEIRLSNTERRDKLIAAAKGAGFIVECHEAIDVSLSGRTGPSYWSISCSVSGRIDQQARRDYREKLRAAWMGL